MLETPKAGEKTPPRTILLRENRKVSEELVDTDHFSDEMRVFAKNLDAAHIPYPLQITTIVFQGDPESREWVDRVLKGYGIVPTTRKLVLDYWMAHMGKFNPDETEEGSSTGSETDKAVAEAIRAKTALMQQQNAEAMLVGGQQPQESMVIVTEGGKTIEMPLSQWMTMEMSKRDQEYKLEMAKLSAQAQRPQQDNSMTIQLEFMKMMQASSMETTKLITTFLTARPAGDDPQKTQLLWDAKMREIQAASDARFTELKTRLEKQDLVEEVKGPLLDKIDQLQRQQNQLLANANNSELQHKMAQEKEMSSAIIAVTKEGIKQQRETRKDLKDIGVKFLDRTLDMTAGNPNANLSPTSEADKQEALKWLDDQVGAAEDGGAALAGEEEPPPEEAAQERPPDESPARPPGRKRGDPLIS